MISMFLYEYDFCCTDLDRLNARHLLWGSASKKGITVIKSVQNPRADRLRGCLFSQKWSNDAKSTNFQLGRATEIAHLLAHCQTWIKKYTKVMMLNLFFTCVLSHCKPSPSPRLGGESIYQILSWRLPLRLTTLDCKDKDTPQTHPWSSIFADECALLSHKDRDLQPVIDSFSEPSNLFGPTVSLRTIEVLHQPAPNSQPS